MDTNALAHNRLTLVQFLLKPIAWLLADCRFPRELGALFMLVVKDTFGVNADEKARP